ncbi:MAG: sulfurtransferase [Proteobacteria bacterium]|jgi:rhodanese-related sulfurtransferase/rubrerythrin|nr:sulfurtransferase [Desulfocapsa sp.]MBU3946131.1 sulfurtransferase [Pseudomonadota bacterium]MCG2742366.1 sulfurtransferase [Desulfobacteraceae bacterium]MBU3982224.1 sulfurtransferase [Pseudomonadota bacterium]MBU4027334.1 sulfurtransferase [Pseudomonadota bacterium]
MNWKSLFTSGANMSPEEARKFMDVHPRDTYQILDVRQPKEYEQGHLAGALLMPVKEVTTRLGELDRDQPLLVYCHSGVRSKAACQLLLAEGFSEVYNMSGGIVAWKGEKISGGELQGLEFFMERDFPDVFHMAYAMEEGLRQLYLGLMDKVANEENKKFLERLAAFEEGHKAMLVAMFAPEDFSGIEDDEGRADDGIVEGGLDRRQIMAHFDSQLDSLEDILQLGIMLEAQALDLYSRLARKSEVGKSRELFHFLAKEEAKHLGYLTEKLDSLLAE